MTNSVNKLLKALDENINLTPDNWVKEHLIIADKKKWVSNILPAELLNRSVKESVEALVTISTQIQYKYSPINDDKPLFFDRRKPNKPWGKLVYKRRQ